MTVMAMGALLLALSGCGDGSTGEVAVATQEEDVESAPPVARAPGEARLIRPDATPGAAMGGAGIEFDLPATWEGQAPGNPMRIAQAVIPGPGGPGELAVFFFGPGGGGGVEANLERWAAQIESDASSPPRRQSYESGPLTVHLMSMEGTLLPSSMGMGPSEPRPDSMLLGAVVEGPGGPWFFKATGPKETLAPETEAFEQMVRGIRLEGAGRT